MTRHTLWRHALPLELAATLAQSGCGSERARSYPVAPGDADGTAHEAEANERPRTRERLVDVSQAESATVMLYLVGSNLESESGLATLDLEEIMRADLGERVNVVIQTMGCQTWHNDEVSPATAQRFTVENGELVCQEPELGQLDSTDPETLTDFIRYCQSSYPADRNILIFWDHGEGPVYGFGYDEFRPSTSSLKLDEMQLALRNAGVRFDFIGFDACLMGCLETACALSSYADYLIASEDFVSGYGWEYQYWLTELGDDVAMDSERLGQTIVDTYVTESEHALDAGILTVVDLQFVSQVYDAWTVFAYANEAALTGANYAWATEISRRGLFSDWLNDSEPEAAMSDYYITDLMALASTLDTPESGALIEALRAAIVYSASTEEDRTYTGLAVTLPYGDRAFYEQLAEVFTGCGFEKNYVAWLEVFARARGADAFYDGWDSWEKQWDNSARYGGWGKF